MKAKPIIFNGPMVRALLDGRKDQTRRVVKIPDHDRWQHFHRLIEASSAGESVVAEFSPDGFTKGHVSCPYGQLGDLLWVRETWGAHDQGFDAAEEASFIVYRADDARPNPQRWRPSIHMPRWASRLTLRITDVRVQRVQEISEEDAAAEGVERTHAGGPWGEESLIESFSALWDSIYAKRGYGWDANPWVWALTFEIIHANVDDVLNERVAA